MARTLLALALLASLPAAASADVRVVTWNVGKPNPFDLRLSKEHEERIAATLAPTDADVILLQELRSDAQAKRLVELLFALGRSYSVTATSADFGRPDGKKTAILHRGPASAIHSARLAGEYGAQAVVLPDVTVISVHTPALNRRARADYCRALIEWVRRLPGPIVVGGDFNLGPDEGAGVSMVFRGARRADERVYEELAAAFDAHTEVGATTTYGHTFDHVFVRGGVIVCAEVLADTRRRPQDHFPLLAVIGPVALEPVKSGAGLVDEVEALTE